MQQPPRAPVPQEVAALHQIRRLIQGLFIQGQVAPQLWWDVTEQRYAVVLPYDVAVPRGLMSRLPWAVLGIPVRVVNVPPNAATGTGAFPGATLVNGVPTPSLTNGTGIGWPVITVSGRQRHSGSILRPIGTASGAMPTVGRYCGPARFYPGKYHDSWPEPLEVVPPWANCPG